MLPASGRTVLSLSAATGPELPEGHEAGRGGLLLPQQLQSAGHRGPREGGASRLRAEPAPFMWVWGHSLGGSSAPPCSGQECVAGLQLGGSASQAPRAQASRGPRRGLALRRAGSQRTRSCGWGNRCQQRALLGWEPTVRVVSDCSVPTSEPSLALRQTDRARPCRPRNGSWTQTEVWLWS